MNWIMCADGTWINLNYIIGMYVGAVKDEKDASKTTSYVIMFATDQGKSLTFKSFETESEAKALMNDIVFRIGRVV